MTSRSVIEQLKMPTEEEQPLLGGQILTHSINIDEARERETRVYQALYILKSTKYTWRQSPIKTLQNKLRILGLDCTVFEDDPILFCTFKHRLSRKFRGNLKKYQPLLSLINQRHWQWQVDAIWEILFNSPIQEDSYAMIEILINVP